MFATLHSKTACCAIVMLMAISGLNAQWSYGAKAGLSLSQLISDRYIGPHYYNGERNPRIGPLGGLFAEWRPENRQFGMRVELLYLEQGEKAPLLRSDGSGVDVNIRYQYLALPILASYSLGPLRIEVGPQLAYLIGTAYRENKETWQNTDFLDIPHFELAANAGLRLAVRRFELGLTYSRGLLNLNRNYTFTDSSGLPLPTSKSPKSFNETLQLALGYRLVN